LDVVYNHLGPGALDLWCFDGWQRDGLGGIYFYNDERARTPWGHTRPDYGRAEVRQFLRDNALMWLDEYHVDGLRCDSTLHIRSVNGPGTAELHDGWRFLQELNQDVRQRFPGKITIAEDLQNDPRLTQGVNHGGAGFGTQWDAWFLHALRAAVCNPRDECLDARRQGGAVPPLQRRRLPARHLHRVARRRGQRQAAAAARDPPARPGRLARPEARRPGRRCPLDRAGDPDAVPGAGVPGAGRLPRHR